MNLARWQRFAEADELFNRMMPGLLSRWPRFSLPANGETAVEWSPSADISETDKEYMIRASLPAVKKEDVKVTIDQGTITIEGERKQEKEDKNEKFHRVESLYGSFSRTFSLPENADADAVRCETRDGVLIVHIPKMQATASKPKQIKVD